MLERLSSLIRDFFEGSLSESDDTPGLVEQPPRNSRGLTKADTRQRYERTQSMDRAVKARRIRRREKLIPIKDNQRKILTMHNSITAVKGSDASLSKLSTAFAGGTGDRYKKTHWFHEFTKVNGVSPSF